MPTVRHLPSLGRKYLLANLVLVGTCLACSAYLFFNAGLKDATFWTVAALAIASGGGSFIVDRLLIRAIPCPTCGRRLPRFKPPKGKLTSVQFECPACDTVWDTERAPTPTSHYSDRL